MKFTKITLTVPSILLLAHAAYSQTPLGGLSGSGNLVTLGRSLAITSDLDNDGYRDLLIGSKDNGDGAVQIRSARTMALLGTTKGQDEFSVQPDDEYGAAVVWLGDRDKDGKPEYLVGAPKGDLDVGFTLVLDAGAVYLREWGTTDLTVLYGNKADARFGSAIAVVGDVNADGYVDFAVSAPFDDQVGGGSNPYADTGTNEGRVILYSGKTLGAIYTWWGQPASEFGASLAGVGDMDGDAFSDLAIGAPGDDTVSGNAGFVTIKSGKLGGTIWSGLGSTPAQRYGAVVAKVGDVNSDGRADVAIAAPGEASNKGAVRVIPGPFGGNPLWTKTGTATGEQFGSRMIALGDMNKDFRGDLMVISLNAGNNNAALRLLDGTNGTQLFNTMTAPTAEGYGDAMAADADIDGDGYVDFVIARPKADLGGADKGMIEWFGAWVTQANLGFGAVNGPVMTIKGTPLQTQGKANLTLGNAAPNSSAYLLVSATTLNVPIVGGILVPNITAGLILPFGTDGTGAFSILGIPGGGGPFTAYVQALIVDGTAPTGYEFSNALKVEILP